MGYEIEMLVGKGRLEADEYELDKEHPFDDGSGFPYKKDEKGDYIKTGRKEKWFQIMARVDLCKLGYQDDSLNQLISESHKKYPKRVYYFYGSDGNTRITEDRYGDPMNPVPIKDVLKAMEENVVHDGPYRRLLWAIALLKAMADDKEELEVMFFGH